MTTKANKSMAIVELEDLTGTIELVAFPECYDRHGALFEPDAILEIGAKLERRGETLQLVCDTATTELTVAPLRPAATRTLHVRLPASGDVWADIAVMHELNAILQRHEGDEPVVLHVPRAGAGVTLRSRSRTVEWNDILSSELRQLLGQERVTIEDPRLAS